MGSAASRPGNLRRLFARKSRDKIPAHNPSRAPQKLADPVIHEVDNPLVTRLKDVYVDSSSTTVSQENPFASERIKRPDNLPQDRTAYTGDVFTVDKSSVGFLTYQEVVDILSERESEGKDVWTAEVVAKKYQIEPTEAANLMKYFSAYRQPTPNPPPRL